MPWWGSRWRRTAGVLLILALGRSRMLAAQVEWNSPAALALAERARDRRLIDRPDTGLTSYQARARGFVLFLAQVGDPVAQPPRLVKADQLAVEVYWRSPSQSKQIIQAWRDGRWLPTDIRYHRDHLGIVTNDFGPRIVIGEGDEVRNVPHPLSAAGGSIYDYALGNSITVAIGAERIILQALDVRPKRATQPGVIGTLYVDTTSAAVVRFQFGFTPASYLDAELSDITVLLENALVEGQWWLPVRQDIEIRRRVSWLDFPAQSIIRARWAIGDYRFNATLSDTLFRGPPIGGLRQAVDTGGPWSRPLAAEVDSEAPPVGADDLTRLRAELSQVAGGRMLERIRPARFGVDGLSDLAHINRVQGLTLGAGFAFGSGTWRIRPRAAYGFDDDRLTGVVLLERHRGFGVTRMEVGRSLVDFSDLPAASRLINSFSAQIWGDDAGDYVRLDRLAVSHSQRLGFRAAVRAEAAMERSSSEGNHARPFNGSYRPNPALGAGTYEMVRLALERRPAPDLKRDWSGGLGLESGAGPTGYSRGTVTLGGHLPAGPGALAGSLFAAGGTAGLPAWRSFALGGRATLPGEEFRIWGGRLAVLARMEWRVELPAPAVPLGAYANTGNRFTLAPFIAAGWAGEAVAGVPWRPSPGIRPVAGVSAEFFLHLLRLEAGIGLKTGRVGFSLDISPGWWPVL